jgi:hypothetical protein
MRLALRDRDGGFKLCNGSACSLQKLYALSKGIYLAITTILDPQNMNFIHMGRASKGALAMDSGAEYQPQLHAYCPHLDWENIRKRYEESYVLDAWYNHIIKRPLTHT